VDGDLAEKSPGGGRRRPLRSVRPARDGEATLGLPAQRAARHDEHPPVGAEGRQRAGQDTPRGRRIAHRRGRAEGILARRIDDDLRRRRDLSPRVGERLAGRAGCARRRRSLRGGLWRQSCARRGHGIGVRADPVRSPGPAGFLSPGGRRGGGWRRCGRWRRRRSGGGRRHVRSSGRVRGGRRLDRRRRRLWRRIRRRLSRGRRRCRRSSLGPDGRVGRRRGGQWGRVRRSGNRGVHRVGRSRRAPEWVGHVRCRVGRLRSGGIGPARLGRRAVR